MHTQKNHLKFRPNVGLMVINHAGKVWLGKRTDHHKFFYNEQMPQGGIEPDETPLQAAYRELWEETGLSAEKVKLLGESKHWYQYRFPHTIKFDNIVYAGQKQKWFLFLHEGNETDFNLSVHPEEIEFVSYHWYSLNEITERVVPFKRHIYKQVIAEFQNIIRQVAQNTAKTE